MLAGTHGLWQVAQRVKRRGPFEAYRQLWIKDESFNPTGSFKARGMSAAVDDPSFDRAARAFDRAERYWTNRVERGA